MSNSTLLTAIANIGSIFVQLSVGWRVQRNEDKQYITLRFDRKKIKYCTACWDDHHKLIQFTKDPSCGEFYCHSCYSRFVYDITAYQEYQLRLKLMQRIRY